MPKRIRSIKRRAFTMIELVMVIVVLGIVSMIATDIIANMYKGYIQTKIINDLEQKTDTLINQIAKRLEYRIKGTMIAREKATDDFLAINSEDINNSSFDMVEWIGSDYESFVGEYNTTKGFSVPGWSGFIDVDNGNTNYQKVVTAGSDLRIAERTIQALSNNEVNLSGAGQHPALIFKCSKGDSNLSRYGWDYSVPNLADHNYTLAVRRVGEDVLHFDTVQTSRNICEQYYLAWTAYALVPMGNDPEDFNLTLRYNYQPWYGERYDQNSTSQVIAEHVSTFRVMQLGETLRVKICMQDGNITGTPVGFCKEKAIF